MKLKRYLPEKPVWIFASAKSAAYSATLSYFVVITNNQSIFTVSSVQRDFEIFKLISSRYKKKESDVEGIVSKVETSDFDDVMENERCQSSRTCDAAKRDAEEQVECPDWI